MYKTKEEIYKKIILALDTPDYDLARSILDELEGLLKIVKIGSATFYRWGDKILKLLKDKKLGIFIDFKFHDIPNTVAEAIEGITPWGIQMFTVHTFGGRAMLDAAVQRTEQASQKLGILRPMVLGISVLTSVDETTLNKDLSVQLSLEGMVSNLAGLAADAGLDGIVASAHEIDLIRQRVGQKLKIVCPGIRALGDSKGDQKRTLSAAQAIQKGADYVVIGRPIYDAHRPREIFEQIVSNVYEL